MIKRGKGVYSPFHLNTTEFPKRTLNLPRTQSKIGVEICDEGELQNPKQEMQKPNI
jgi:hypothetical protein